MHAMPFAGSLVWRNRAIPALLLAAAMSLGSVLPVRAADSGFTRFIASLWPEAQAAGVARAVFDAETRGLDPDDKLPDLILPGRPATGAPSQAEFVQVPADYVKESSIARLAAEGQRLMAKHRATLGAIETRFGVPGSIVLAIWGRETDYGRHRLPYDGLRVLATQAYVGRRKEQYRVEFIAALKLIGDGVVTRKDLRSSWAGATGLTQFLPAATSGVRCRTRWLPRPNNSSTRAGSRACAGPMKCARLIMPIAPWACPR